MKTLATKTTTTLVSHQLKERKRVARTWCSSGKIYRISWLGIEMKMLNFFNDKTCVCFEEATIRINFHRFAFFSFFFLFFCPFFVLYGTHFHWPHFIKLNYFTRNTLVNRTNWKVIRRQTLKKKACPPPRVPFIQPLFTLFHDTNSFEVCVFSPYFFFWKMRRATRETQNTDCHSVVACFQHHCGEY